MRGLICIVSARAPYLRAGLSFAGREPVEVDVRDLDGARLVELLTDPQLTMTFGHDDGSFKPVEIMSHLNADQAQMMIDALSEELPARVVPFVAIDDVATLTERLQRQAERITELVDNDVARGSHIHELQSQIEERDAKIAHLGTVLTARDQMIASKNEMNEELQAEIVKLKAAPSGGYQPRAAKTSGKGTPPTQGSSGSKPAS